MTVAEARAERVPKTQQVDVLIVGAGISGLGSTCHLLRDAPGKTFAIVEAKESYGGTWHTHRYPGVRSDSDLHTFGYAHKPWRGHPIASASQILSYLGEVIEEEALDQYITYNTRVVSAHWSSADNLWTVETENSRTGASQQIKAGFLWMCQGYYRHTEGYTPDWPGMTDYRGRILHPQTWPDDADLKGKRVVIIGSGATAATIVPAVANDVSHVTMLQRSPTYFFSRPNVNELAEKLRSLNIDPAWTHEIVRKDVLQTMAMMMKVGLENPEAMRQQLLDLVRGHLGDDYTDKHFTPTYAPFTQRVCLVPDGDFFEAIKSGKASVVTDEIERFTPEGILLKSGETLEADVIITATGFNLNVLGDIEFTIDNRPLDMAQTINYRGMMFTGVPNLIWVFGYFRASWTLRVDLIGRFVTRLLNYMDEKGYHRVEPALRPEDADLELGPWVDPDDFNPGYLNRGMHLMPKAGAKREWRHSQDYWSEKDEIPALDLEDPAFAYA